MRVLAVIIFSVFWVGIASAQDAAAPNKDTAVVMGLGASSCAEFSQAYRDDPTTAMRLYFDWAQGFMSGVNVLHAANRRPTHNLSGRPVSEQQDILRGLCDQKPQALFVDAVQELYFRLSPPASQSN
jgi:hypothetical protein